MRVDLRDLHNVSVDRIPDNHCRLNHAAKPFPRGAFRPKGRTALPVPHVDVVARQQSVPFIA